MRLLVVPLAGAVAMVGGGCSRRAGVSADAAPLAIGRLAVRELSAPEDRVPGLGAREVETLVEARLRASSVVRRVEPSSPGAYHLTLQVGIGRPDGEADSSDDAEAARFVALVSGRGTVLGRPEALELQASAARPLASSGDVVRERRRVLRGLVETVLDDLLYQARLATARDTEVVAALRDRDHLRAGAAAEIAAHRRIAPAVPALVALLKHPDERLADRAIGALIAIGDRRAVPHLTRLAKFSDTAKLTKLLDGIATLGGDEAREYLEFVAVGHGDEEIRGLATEALDRLKRREAGSGRAPSHRR
ncbi:MAG: HEAT repeat domain-containing protein [Deltaproteobacteria bacterium]|nr:HEAT repeat domain-containing protein [Deltaproteobacteria bacterium]